MTKIVHIHHSLMPGMGYQENQLPGQIAELGYDIEIITSSFLPAQFSNQDREFEPGVYEYNGVKTHRLPTRFRLESIGQGFLRGLEKKLKKIDPDIIQSRSLLTTQTPRVARFAKKHNVCLFIDEHVDNDNFNINSTLVRFGYNTYKKTIAQYVIKECDLFLPVQPYSEAFLSNEFNISSTQMEILPLGVDKDTFYKDDKQGWKIREKHGISEKEILILTSGNFNSRKDLDVLIDSISYFTDDQDIKLMFVGRPSGPEGEKYYKKLRRKVDNKGLQSKVIFQGFVSREKLNAYYNAADIGVWPGKLGITTAEAVGSGLPIIVCESLATKYLISQNNGLTFERGNPEDLYRQLMKYVESGDLTKRHSKNSIEASIEELSWEAIAKKNIELYDQIC